MKTLIDLIENHYTVKFEREFGRLKITVTDFNNNSGTSLLPSDSEHITEERIEDVLKFEKKRIAQKENEKRLEQGKCPINNDDDKICVHRRTTLTHRGRHCTDCGSRF